MLLFFCFRFLATNKEPCVCLETPIGSNMVARHHKQNNNTGVYLCLCVLSVCGSSAALSTTQMMHMFLLWCNFYWLQKHKCYCSSASGSQLCTKKHVSVQRLQLDRTWWHTILNRIVIVMCMCVCTKCMCTECWTRYYVDDAYISSLV